MAFINLEAKTTNEELFKRYLEQNASDVLAEKINTGKKTLAGAMSYVMLEAKKMAKNASSICIDDQTVFGWVVHYFEEDSISEGNINKENIGAMAKGMAARINKTREAKKKEEVEAVEPQEKHQGSAEAKNVQLDIFALLNGGLC